MLLLVITVGAALAFSTSGSRNNPLTSGLNDFVGAGVVLSSFPRAMLIMSGAFGLWRAGLISNALFAAGVAAGGPPLLSGTPWLGRGCVGPDGGHSPVAPPHQRCSGGP